MAFMLPWMVITFVKPLNAPASALSRSEPCPWTMSGWISRSFFRVARTQPWYNVRIQPNFGTCNA